MTAVLSTPTLDSCMDPSVSFGSFGNLFHCFQIYGLPQQDSSTSFAAAIFRDYGGWDNAVEKGYYLHANSTFGAMIGECLDQYCHNPDPELGGCDQPGHSRDKYYKLYGPSMPKFETSSCESINDDPNDDLGGIGVFVSFFMQVGITLYIYLAFRLLELVPVVTRLFRILPASLTWWLQRETKMSISRRGTEVQSYLKTKFGHHFSVLKSMMVDFQESQCFFMLSFQCTILIALSAGPQVFNATSMSQLKSNISTARVVSLMGVLPITFGLWMLNKFRLHSWYILLWSTITITVSNVTLYMSSLEPSVENLDDVATVENLDKCGFHSPPIAYCSRGAGDVPFFLEINLVSYMNIICLVSYGLLVMDRLVPYLNRWLGPLEWYQRAYRGVLPVLASKGVVITSRILTGFIELLLLLASLYYGFYTAIRGIIGSEPSSWSFGQIIAVTIWAPTICKYLYWTAFGTESYSAIRLPPPYKIIRVEPHDADDDPSDESRLFINLRSTSDLGLNQRSPCVTVTDVEMTGTDKATKDSFRLGKM